MHKESRILPRKLAWLGYKNMQGTFRQGWRDGSNVRRGCEMKPVELRIKGTTGRKLERFAEDHPEGFYLSYGTVIEDLLSGKVKRRVRVRE